MEDRHIQQLIQNLIDRFELYGENQFHLDEELEILIHPVTRNPLSDDIVRTIEQAFLERIRYKRSHDGAILIPVSIVADPRDHEEWYGEWFASHHDSNGSYYWRRLEDFLSNELTHKYGADSAGEIVRSIDEATFSILDKLANPFTN